MTSVDTIIIYRSGLLPSTQTFITAQAGAVRSFAVRYAGLLPVDGGLPAAAKPVLLASTRSTSSRAREGVYKVFGFAPAFQSALEKLRPSLLHAHFTLDGIHALPLVRALKIPLLVTLHGHIPTGAGRALPKFSVDGILYRSRLDLLWKRTETFICVSEFVRQKAIDQGFPEQKLRVHYVGVDLRLFRRTADIRDPNMVLFVGRLVEKKGCTYLLQAMARLKERCRQAHLVVVGDGPERSKLEIEAKTLRLPCLFVGNCSPMEVLSWLRRARVFCGPSVTAKDGDAEALGMVFAEAQSVGLPAVSFRHGGIPEVVRDGYTGLLARERNVEDLSNYLMRYLCDDQYWQFSSQEATEWIQQRFCLNKQTLELERLYRSSIDDHFPYKPGSEPSRESIYA